MSDLEKIALFINGPNLHHTARRLGFDVDFKRLLARFGQYGSLVRAYYYTVVDEGGVVRAAAKLSWIGDATPSFNDAEVLISSGH